MQNFKSFGPLGAELQASPGLRNRTLLPTFSNDLKNVSRHCGGHYNFKIKHFEDFSGMVSGWGVTLNLTNVSKYTLYIFCLGYPYQNAEHVGNLNQTY